MEHNEKRSTMKLTISEKKENPPDNVLFAYELPFHRASTIECM